MEVPFSRIICSICNDILKQPIKLSGCEHHFCIDCTLPNTNDNLDRKSCPECEVSFKKYVPACDEVKDRISEYECKMYKIDMNILLDSFIELTKSEDLSVQFQDAVRRIIVALNNACNLEDLSTHDYNLLYDILTNRSSSKILKDHGFYKNVRSCMLIEGPEQSIDVHGGSQLPLNQTRAEHDTTFFQGQGMLSHFVDENSFKQHLSNFISRKGQPYRSHPISYAFYGIFKGKKIILRIGKGGYGLVYRVSKLDCAKFVNVKLIGCPYSVEVMRRCIIEILLQFNELVHPYIVRYDTLRMDALKTLPVFVSLEMMTMFPNFDSEKDDEYNLVMLRDQTIFGFTMKEYEGNISSWIQSRNVKFFSDECDQGNIIRYVEQRPLRFDDSDINQLLVIARNIGSAVKFYQNYRVSNVGGNVTYSIIHRDLKPSNILYEYSDGVPSFLISDFGVAGACGYGKSMTDQGMAYYRPPDQYKENYSNAVDIYPLGIIFFELFYPVQNKEELKNWISKIQDDDDFPEHLDKLLPQISSLIKRMVSRDPNLRPDSRTIVDLLNNQIDSRGINNREMNYIRFKLVNGIELYTVKLSLDDTIFDAKLQLLEYENFHAWDMKFNGISIKDNDQLNQYPGIEYGVIEFKVSEHDTILPCSESPLRDHQQKQLLEENLVQYVYKI